MYSFYASSAMECIYLYCSATEIAAFCINASSRTVFNEEEKKYFSEKHHIKAEHLFPMRGARL